MARKNAAGKTWKQHAAPYLRRALKTASRTWKPRGGKTNRARLNQLRKRREEINEKIRKELGK